MQPMGVSGDSEGRGLEAGGEDCEVAGSGRRRVLGGLALVAGAAAVVRAARGGPLDPPPGPVSATPKPLREVEPRIAVNATNTPPIGSSLFVISQPGSYYLTGNITVPAGSGVLGIRIVASGVRLDLCGFCIRGNGAAGTTGIGAVGEFADIAIRNGSVSGLVAGISLGTCHEVVVEDVVARNNGASGGVRLGARARVSRVQAFANAGEGITTGEGSTVSGCIARGNALSGIRVQSGSVVEHCIAAGNGGSGIEAGALACVVRHCIAAGNAVHGITRLVGGGTVRGPAVVACAATGNTQRGIWSTGASISGCAARANGQAGIYAEECAVEQCVSALNVSASLGAPGYDLRQGSSLVESVAYMNQGVGARVENACRVERSVLRNNSLDGIHVPVLSGRNLILGNSCSGNGQAGPNTAGIRIEGGPCRVEGNLCTFGSGYGVWVTGSANILTRNACAGNVINWNIGPINEYGPVVDRTAPASAGMLGNGTAPSTLQTTDLHANFSF